MEFDDNDSLDKIISEKKKKFGDIDVNIVYIESPANPTNQIIDIEKCSELAKKLSTKNNKALLLIDNTFMGPIWSKPIDFGADVVLYSVTKYLGGHSDIIMGSLVLNKSENNILSIISFAVISFGVRVSSNVMQTSGSSKIAN